MERRSASWLGELISARPWAARVLSVHSRALNLLRDDGFVVSLVSHELDLTAMSAAVPELEGLIADQGGAGDLVGRRVSSDGSLIEVPGLGPIETAGARSWSGRARRDRPIEPASLREARFALLEVDRPRSLALLLAPPAAPEPVAVSFARDGLTAWTAAPGTRPGLSGLVGLGPGLTPAGDDFLTGILLADLADGVAGAGPAPSRVSHADRDSIASALRTTTAPGRTLLHQALLQRFPAYLLAFLQAIRDASSPGEVREAVYAACGHGATSGSDGLAGFLWLAGRLGETDCGPGSARLPPDADPVEPTKGNAYVGRDPGEARWRR